MAVERESFLSVLEDSYTAYYNINKEDLPQDLPIVFKADYFRRGEKYWLSKSIPIWGNETNEFAYVFSSEVITVSQIEKAIQYALDDGLPRVKPHKEHQYTNIKTVFIANQFEDGALDLIKKKKFSKSYHWSLWGYTNLICCGVNTETEQVAVNKVGHDMQAYFKKLFAAQHKKKD